jgi:hypothetical protein
MTRESGRFGSLQDRAACRSHAATAQVQDLGAERKADVAVPGPCAYQIDGQVRRGASAHFHEVLGHTVG